MTIVTWLAVAAAILVVALTVFRSSSTTMIGEVITVLVLLASQAERLVSSGGRIRKRLTLTIATDGICLMCGAPTPQEGRNGESRLMLPARRHQGPRDEEFAM